MDKIREILEEIRPDVNFDEVNDLIAEKILNSMSIVRLVMALEDEFDIKISPVYIVPENFQTIDAIAKLVEKCEEE